MLEMSKCRYDPRRSTNWTISRLPLFSNFVGPDLIVPHPYAKEVEHTQNAVPSDTIPSCAWCIGTPLDLGGPLSFVVALSGGTFFR